MRLPLTALLLAGVVACGPPPLTTAHPSSKDLARAVLDAVARRDEAALRSLAVTEGEFRAHVWPSLPVARPERNLPFSYVWGDLRQKSDTFLTATLARHGGRPYELVEVTFESPPTEYNAFRVHRDSRFVVREASGPPHEVRLCGSFLEKDGAWKVFSYVVDD